MGVYHFEKEIKKVISTLSLIFFSEIEFLRNICNYIFTLNPNRNTYKMVS